jgi:hypothetical protein
VNAIGGLFFGSDVNGAFASGTVMLTARDSLGATSTQTITSATLSSFLGFQSTGRSPRWRSAASRRIRRSGRPSTT